MTLQEYFEKLVEVPQLLIEQLEKCDEVQKILRVSEHIKQIGKEFDESSNSRPK